MMNLSIESAAMRHTETKSLWLGGCHALILSAMEQENVKADKWESGFITNAGTFVTRDEAKVIAEKVNQVIPGTKRAGGLYSEQLQP